MSKEKYVDESWKEQATQEKDVLAEESTQQVSQGKTSTENPSVEAANQNVQQDQGVEGGAQQAQSGEINFLNYITSLGFQAMIFMGEIPNPMTNKIDKNLEQAKFLIDTLSMLREKTEGNLNDQEKALLENSVYELQTKYVQVSDNAEPIKEEKA